MEPADGFQMTSKAKELIAINVPLSTNVFQKRLN
jgi:hypothetical protein